MEPTRTYDRHEAFDVLKNSAFRGGKVNRLLESYKKNPNADLSMVGNSIILSVPGKRKIVVNLAQQEKNKTFTISRFFKYSIRGKNYKKDYDAKINKILDKLYLNPPEAKKIQQSKKPSSKGENYNKGMKLIKEGETASELKQGISLLEQAAKEDHPQALFELGKIYHTGVAGELDIDKAIFYYEKASKLGVKAATQALAGIQNPKNLIE